MEILEMNEDSDEAVIRIQPGDSFFCVRKDGTPVSIFPKYRDDLKEGSPFSVVVTTALFSKMCSDPEWAYDVVREVFSPEDSEYEH